jgi:hypothetical protein
MGHVGFMFLLLCVRLSHVLQGHLGPGMLPWLQAHWAGRQQARAVAAVCCAPHVPSAVVFGASG